ncbi:unnamed protein product [Brassica rapa subsp. trilocularis]
MVEVTEEAAVVTEDARVDTMVVVQVATFREKVVAEDTVEVADVRWGIRRW